MVTNSSKPAKDILKTLKTPLVVKPTDSDRGEGVSIDIMNEEMLSQAINEALNYSKAKKVLVEQQAEGVCHRIFIVNGQLLYAVKRLPRIIIADGKNSIAELSEILKQQSLSAPPWKRDPIIPLDAEALSCIHKAGYNPESIPDQGKKNSVTTD